MAIQIITPARGKQHTAKRGKAQDRTKAPQSAPASNWRTIATSARDAACNLMEAAEERAEQEMDTDGFLRLMNLATIMLGQFSFQDEQRSKQECERVVFDTMAMINGALHTPEEMDSVARSLGAQTYDILDKMSDVMTSGSYNPEYERIARAAIEAATVVDPQDAVPLDAARARGPCDKKSSAQSPKRVDDEPVDIEGLILRATCHAHEACAVLSAITEELNSNAAYGGSDLAEIAAKSLESISQTDTKEDECNPASNALCVAIAVLTMVAHQDTNIALWASISLLESSKRHIDRAIIKIIRERQA
ncbi:hypothetical protein H7F36_02775 [Variovorax sp. PAMC28562]|uniref:hypothetical protein n=1 Tax=Variovorax sp. PAMC28562 TaxID=2762323 RepID=UPI00164D4580|nr:hypothetical protein [Variovorax sp. PAMC28562]QNK74189.1 hypothetical protein H7F36_02775 [Variovorax sp. PAMC28562]